MGSQSSTPSQGPAHHHSLLLITLLPGLELGPWLLKKYGAGDIKAKYFDEVTQGPTSILKTLHGAYNQLE